MSPDILKQFQKVLTRDQVVKNGDRLLIACSAGPDSVALFHLMRVLSPLFRWHLSVAHFHHGLRREADQDWVFVKTLANKFKIPCYVGQAQVKSSAREQKESLEEAGRRLRYEFLIQTARRHRISKIVLAHHQDDQAETVLMRILQGTGLRGLAGIRRHWVMQGVTIYRPLLDFSKASLLSFLKGNQWKFRKDLTNRSVRYFRNRIRCQLIPELVKNYNPQVTEALARIPSIIEAELDWMQAVEEKAFGQIVRRQGKRVVLSRARFAKCSSALQFRLLERALKLLDTKSGMSFDQWGMVRHRLQETGFRYSLPRDIDLEVLPRQLVLFRRKFAKTR